jgi:hypothetical protein
MGDEAEDEEGGNVPAGADRNRDADAVATANTNGGNGVAAAQANDPGGAGADADENADPLAANGAQGVSNRRGDSMSNPTASSQASHRNGGPTTNGLG